MMYAQVFCSQCGQSFGPGNHGYSHCEDHREITLASRAAWRKDKHTPGPWNIGSSDLPVSGMSVHGGNRQHTTIARLVDSSLVGMPFDENYANARLMSAAPDMLEALKRLEAVYRVSHSAKTRADCWRQARAAIAKATGE